MKWSLILAFFILSGCYRDSATLNSTAIENETPALAKKSPRSHKLAQTHSSNLSGFQPRKFSAGETLYINFCADCHGWEGRGNGQAEMFLDTPPPVLLRHDLLAKQSVDDFVKWVLTGSEMQVQLKKEALIQTDSEIHALLTYIKQIPDIDWNQIQAGQNVYDRLCIGCHGLYGNGGGNLTSKMPGPMPDLSSVAYQSQHSDQELIQIISKGKDAMAGTEDVLGPKEIESVTAFLRLLSPGYESYDRFCLACHGENGSPTKVIMLDKERNIAFQNIDLPTFDAKYFKTHSDEQLIPKIQHMLKTERVAMPHFSGYIEEKTVRDIFKYLNSLIAEYP